MDVRCCTDDLRMEDERGAALFERLEYDEPEREFAGAASRNTGALDDD